MHDYRDIFQNCLEVQVKDGVYFPVRFTQRLFDFYSSIGASRFSERMVQTAGITLEFITRDEIFGFDFFFTCFARDWIAFDIYENGIFMETMSFPDRTPAGTFLYKKRSEGETKIEVYIPATADTHIKNFNLRSYRPVEEEKKKYLALGCSITQGMEAEAPSITYTNIVRRHLDAELLNLGIGGFVYNKDSLDENLPFGPDVITVAYGTNDTAGKENAERIGENAACYMEKLSCIYPDKPVNVITPLWRKEYDEDPDFRRKADLVRGYIEREAKQQGFHIVDGRRAVPHQTGYFKDRYLHPSDLGFALYGLYVLKNMKVC